MGWCYYGVPCRTCHHHASVSGSSLPPFECPGSEYLQPMRPAVLYLPPTSAEVFL